MTEITQPPRRYFTVLDEAGHHAPAMEYWATTPDDCDPVQGIGRLRKFVKLIGSGECLDTAGDGVFIARWSQRTFFQLPPMDGAHSR